MNLLAGLTSSLEGELLRGRGLVTWGSDCRLYGVLVLGEMPENLSGLLSVSSSSLVVSVVSVFSLVAVDGGRLLVLLLLNKLVLVSCEPSDDIIGCIRCTCWLMADRSSCISLSCLPTLRI